MQSVSAPLLNGDFSNSLTNWTTVGDVTVVGGQAIIGDDGAGAGYSALYQGVALAPGDYTVEFDFSGDFSAGFDFLAATIYFTNDLSAFDPFNAVFDDAIALFDLDDLGIIPSSGSEDPSGHWSAEFTNNYAYVIPAFEMFDFTFAGDSTVAIDNVTIASVPEPGTWVLVMIGLIGVMLFRRKTSHQQSRITAMPC